MLKTGSKYVRINRQEASHVWSTSIAFSSSAFPPNIYSLEIWSGDMYYCISNHTNFPSKVSPCATILSPIFARDLTREQRIKSSKQNQIHVCWRAVLLWVMLLVTLSVGDWSMLIHLITDDIKARCFIWFIIVFWVCCPAYRTASFVYEYLNIYI